MLRDDQVSHPEPQAPAANLSRLPCSHGVFRVKIAPRGRGRPKFPGRGGTLTRSQSITECGAGLSAGQLPPNCTPAPDLLDPALAGRVDAQAFRIMVTFLGFLARKDTGCELRSSSAGDYRSEAGLLRLPRLLSRGLPARHWAKTREEPCSCLSIWRSKFERLTARWRMAVHGRRRHNQRCHSRRPLAYWLSPHDQADLRRSTRH
jgi:hypothetical protein